MKKALHILLVSLLWTSMFFFPPEASASPLRLNEILPAPDSDWDGNLAFDSSDDEWVEIFNTADSSLDLSGHYLLNGSGRLIVYGFEGTLAPNSPLVVYGTSARQWQASNGRSTIGLSLNNSGDNVYLARISGSDTTIIDSLVYSSSQVRYDCSIGREADGIGNWVLFDHLNPSNGNGLDPTPGLSNLEDPPPHIFTIYRQPPFPTSLDSTTICVDAGDASGIVRALLAYDINLEDGEEPDMMLVSGNSNRGKWCYTILPCNEGDTVHYRVSLYDISSATISPWMGYRVRSATIGVRLNEILADPASDPSGDANRDGIRDSSQDEFVEISNCSTQDIDISGWKLKDASSIRHVFAEGTIIRPGEFITVFGGGTPTGFDGQVFVASTGSLSLNNSGDTVALLDQDGNVVDTHTYGSEGNKDQSMIRLPDCIGEWTLPSLGGIQEPFTPNESNYGSSSTDQTSWGEIKALFK